MVAIEAKTGKYRWHFQQVHHDLWDYDGPSAIILFDVRVGGKIRKAAAEANKAGWVYILDRITGKPLIGIDEKPVPQEPRQRTNWPPSSYDPATNYFYVCATDAATLFKGGEEDEQITPEGQRYLGSAFGGAPIPGSGIFAALDMKTNRLVWQQRWKDPCYSGSVATAGGLVFTGRNDGRLTALNSSTGKRLWEFQTGAGLNAPVSIFEYEGEQYVAAYSAGSLFAGSPRGDSVWLFSLKGTIEEGASNSTTVVPAPAEHQ
jgi:quinohemoprotein ethanol dehydrogenase